MSLSRRSFLASILAAGVAPAFAGSGVLMPVKKIVVPELLVEDMGRTNYMLYSDGRDPDAYMQDWFMPEAGEWQRVTRADELETLKALGGVHLRSLRSPAELWDPGKGLRVTAYERTLLTIHQAAKKSAASFDFTEPPRVLHFQRRLSDALLADLTR